jgi:ElaB/YqjD/DUF883 family membrane-anchored ribosome-binding protein
MKESLLGRTAAAGAQVAHIGLEAARMKGRVEHVMEDGVTAARRAVKRGRYAAEDLLDETSYRVKRNPLSAIAVSFCVGVGIGAIVIWIASRNHSA